MKTLFSFVKRSGYAGNAKNTKRLYHKNKNPILADVQKGFFMIGIEYNKMKQYYFENEETITV